MLESNKSETGIYFKGQIYDAYSKLLDILSKSKNEIIIIDNYVDKRVLDIISRLKIRVILITRKITKYSKLTLLDIEHIDLLLNEI